MGTIKKMTKSKLYFTIFSFFLLIHGQNILTASAEENHVLIGVKFTGEYPEKREDGSGAFRTHCVESHLKNDDPLMFYGEPEKPISMYFLATHLLILIQLLSLYQIYKRQVAMVLM